MGENYLSLLEMHQLERVIKTNEYTSQFGLLLSQEDARQLVVNRNECLREQQRVEFGEGILTKLIFAFCDSSYMYQDNFAESISRLQEIFYLYKNESLDELTDDELISYMRDVFDGECQGDLEYLEGTFLDGFAREIRENPNLFFNGPDKDKC